LTGALFGTRSNFGRIREIFSEQGFKRKARLTTYMSVTMHSDPSDDEAGSRWHRWLKVLPARLFAVGWALAVVIASAGWFYFIFRIIWYFIGPLFQ
jgi:hypothetical protein